MFNCNWHLSNSKTRLAPQNQTSRWCQYTQQSIVCVPIDRAGTASFFCFPKFAVLCKGHSFMCQQLN